MPSQAGAGARPPRLRPGCRRRGREAADRITSASRSATVTGTGRPWSRPQPPIDSSASRRRQPPARAAAVASASRHDRSGLPSRGRASAIGIQQRCGWPTDDPASVRMQGRNVACLSMDPLVSIVDAPSSSLGSAGRMRVSDCDCAIQAAPQFSVGVTLPARVRSSASRSRPAPMHGRPRRGRDHEADDPTAQPTDLELAALISSKICHDVINPVGAIYNGLELLNEEDDADASPTRSTSFAMSPSRHLPGCSSHASPSVRRVRRAP